MVIDFDNFEIIFIMVVFLNEYQDNIIIYNLNGIDGCLEGEGSKE
jgi:hypothetical protein